MGDGRRGGDVGRVPCVLGPKRHGIHLTRGATHGRAHKHRPLARVPARCAMGATQHGSGVSQGARDTVSRAELPFENRVNRERGTSLSFMECGECPHMNALGGCELETHCVQIPCTGGSTRAAVRKSRPSTGPSAPPSARILAAIRAADERAAQRSRAKFRPRYPDTPGTHVVAVDDKGIMRLVNEPAVHLALRLTNATRSLGMAKGRVYRVKVTIGARSEVTQVVADLGPLLPDGLR